jgi:hypothetical protein
MGYEIIFYFFCIESWSGFLFRSGGYACLGLLCLLLIDQFIEPVIDADQLFKRIELRQLRNKFCAILRGEGILMFQLSDQKRQKGVAIDIIFTNRFVRPFADEIVQERAAAGRLCRSYIHEILPPWLDFVHIPPAARPRRWWDMYKVERYSTSHLINDVEKCHWLLIFG